MSLRLKGQVWLAGSQGSDFRVHTPRRSVCVPPLHIPHSTVFCCCGALCLSNGGCSYSNCLGPCSLCCAQPSTSMCVAAAHSAPCHHSDIAAKCLCGACPRQRYPRVAPSALTTLVHTAVLALSKARCLVWSCDTLCACSLQSTSAWPAAKSTRKRRIKWARQNSSMRRLAEGTIIRVEERCPVDVCQAMDTLSLHTRPERGMASRSII